MTTEKEFAEAVNDVLIDQTLSNVAIGSYASGIQVNGVPSQQINRNMWTTIGVDDNLKATTVELQCTDGSKALLRLSSLDNICNVEKRKSKSWGLQRKFPFIQRKEIPYVHFTYQRFYRSTEKQQEKSYDVLCSLSAFCKLVGIEYRSFSQAMLEDAVQNG